MSTSSYQQGDFDGEKRNCDVVMKGGITSGVVYPLALVELAKDYRFKNIGGASAGAIAAGMAAAAELGRSRNGFVKLAQVADEVGGILLSLFQPAPSLKPLFNIFRAIAGRRSTVGKLWGICLSLCWGFKWTTAMGLLPGVFIGYKTIMAGYPLSICLPLAALTAIALWLPLMIWKLHRAIFRKLPRNNFGLCSGMRTPRSKRPALTEWLARKIDDIAGFADDTRRVSGKPLTFGDLDAAGINLEVMTTNLTAGHPLRMPFDTKIFFYRKEDFQKIFPEYIMSWLEAHAGSDEHDRTFLRFPDRDNLPVIVAVRMSLSFPFLLTAVPLYARDYTLRKKADGAVPNPERCWFSDGGICSNFPIHFFDSIWPRWPTFGITLESFSAAHHDESDRVFLPGQARHGILRNFGQIDSVGGFISSILDSMQEWQDVLQSTLPGYRDRIAHVRLNSDEGGLNVDMPEFLVRKLANYGREAGIKFKGFDWHTHRWTRYVTSMGEFEYVLKNMENAYSTGAPGDGNLQGLLQKYLGAEDPKSYKQAPWWKQAAEQKTEKLVVLAQQWAQIQSLQKGAMPKPEVVLRITPDI